MNPGKKTLTGMLAAACILSAIMLAVTPSPPHNPLRTEAQLDSLILVSLQDVGIPSRNVRTNTISIDTLFTRKELRVEVPPGFSKTTYHLQLHHALKNTGIDCPARVVLPENTMNIYLTYNGTVHRTIRLITNQPARE